MKSARIRLFLYSLLFAGTLPGLYAQSTSLLRGVVLDASGTPIPSVSLSLLSAEMVREDHTDEKGTFEFVDLPLGAYELLAKSPKSQGYAQSFDLTDPIGRQVSIVLQAGAACGSETTASYEGRTGKWDLIGNVRDYWNHSAVKNATVTVTQIQSRKANVAVSDKDGHFQFATLEPGKYEIKASHEGYAEWSDAHFWITAQNQTRLTAIYIFRKSERGLIVCQ